MLTPPTPPARASAPAGATAHVAVPGSVLLRYTVTGQHRRGPWQGTGELLWRHDGQRYEAQFEINAPSMPARVQRSTGLITAHGLAPLRFSEKTRSEQAAHFERDAQRLSFSNNRPATPLLAGAQDRLSVLLQLGAMLGGEPQKYPRGSTLVMQTASTRDAEPWAFTLEGEEQLELGGSVVPALKLVRPPRHEFDQRLEIWLAPGLDYVPVRLRLTQPNGDWVDQQWSSTDRR